MCVSVGRGGEDLLNRQAGCTGAYYLPLAADPMLHRPEPLDDEGRRTFGCDLVFVGQYRPEHAASLLREA